MINQVWDNGYILKVTNIAYCAYQTSETYSPFYTYNNDIQKSSTTHPLS